MKVRQMTSEDITQVASIEKIAWNQAGATIKQIKSRLEVCPEGSIVVVTGDGKIVGYAAAQRVSELSTQSWEKQTDCGFIKSTHQKNGHLAYGVGMSALPEAARMGVSSAIIEHYASIFILESDCSALCLGSRLPGYFRWKQQHKGSMSEYLLKRRKGYSIDPELCLYERAGFNLLWPIEDYFPDESSNNYGAMIIQTRNDVLQYHIKQKTT